MNIREIGRLLVIAGVAMPAFCANSPGDVPIVINQIAAIEYEKSPTKAIRLLEQLESFDFWGIGGGRGPTDRSSLSMSVLTASRPFMSWDVNPRQVPDSSSPSIQSWLKADPRSTETMQSMLRSDDPLPRWISLTKLSVTRVSEGVLLEHVRKLAEADDYIVIRRQSVALAEGSEHVFDIPLRRLAIEILKAADQQAPVFEYDAIAKEGLRWLAESYLARRTDKLAEMGIMGALNQLTPKTAEIATAQAALSEARTPDAVQSVFEGLIPKEQAARQTRKMLQSSSTRATLITQITPDSLEMKSPPLGDDNQQAPETRWFAQWKIGMLIAGFFMFGVFFALRSRK